MGVAAIDTARARQEKLKTSPIAAVLSSVRSSFVAVAVFSFAVNLFMLTGPLFMLQVYDRVLTSRSIPTLIALYILVVALFGFLGLFNFLRTRLLSRIGFKLDFELMETAEKARIINGLSVGQAESRPTADLSRIRQFVSSTGLLALFDLPWTPIFLAVVFYMHPWLGWLTVGGIALITLMTIANEFLTRKKIGDANIWEMESARFSDLAHRNAEAIVSMGMLGNTLQHWKRMRLGGLAKTQTAGNVSESMTSLSRAVRLLLQSSILGLGAYLAVFGIITPGTMIAASIIGGRALAPIDQVVGNWKNFISSRQAYKRLDAAVSGKSAARSLISLPSPEGHLTASSVVKLAPRAGADDGHAILQGLSFTLSPGDAMGVIGPSASGKTSLARLLTGLWLPDRGSVRLDGATYDQWDSDELGKYIGYLPQSVELMRGTIHQNIARFDPQAKDEDIIAAAKLANVNDLILSLPGGYTAEVGGGQVVLSGGQRQRIALARALYGNPPLVVLDEPNSNLDAEGDAALAEAIAALRQQNRTIVVMAHRPSALASCNKVLMLRDGHQMDFGDKEEVLRRVTQQANNNISQKGGL